MEISKSSHKIIQQNIKIRKVKIIYKTLQDKDNLIFHKIKEIKEMNILLIRNSIAHKNKTQLKLQLLICQTQFLNKKQ